MMTTLEKLPNEILLNIFSNLSWSQLLTSLWSLNKRFDILICSVFSLIDNQYNNGLIVTESGLSSNQFSSLLFQLSSSPLNSCIRRVHFDGKNTNIYDFIDEYLFDKENSIFRFPNLKILSLTQCLSIKPFIKILPLLIKYQLDELRLTFDENFVKLFPRYCEITEKVCQKRKHQRIFNKFICQLFSPRCRLTSLRLGPICVDATRDFYRCLTNKNNLSSCSIFDKYQSYPMTLRRLHIHVKDRCTFEQLFEHVPALEKLSVYFLSTLIDCERSMLDIETLIQTNGNWFNKVPKLQCFTLHTEVYNDSEFAYLKWILNNLNHIKKFKLYLRNWNLFGPDRIVWKSVFDANFIRQYCLPDEVINLTYFDIYMSSRCELTMNNPEQIINSFQIHPFFIDHRWTNVKYYHGSINSYQHVSLAATYTPRFFNNLINNNRIFHWPHTRHVYINLHPSLHDFLEQFDELFPNVYCIKLNLEYGKYSFYQALIPFETEKYRLTDIRLRNVTRLDFSYYLPRPTSYDAYGSSYTITTPGKLLAYLISMPIQLKDLRVDHFEWLLYVVKYALSNQTKNALNTVRYAEFGIPSCHRASNELIHTGENLVPFLSNYMPHLQTLRLWRPDDFPWTSIRPDFKKGVSFSFAVPRWYESLRKSKSIKVHVNLFKEDLSQLFEHMKELVFLDIRGEIHKEKVKPYRSMVQTCFPNSRCNVEIFRFCLWL